MLNPNNLYSTLSFWRLGLPVAALLLAVLGRGPVARADGVVRDSLGAIPSGRGGTNLAFTDNLSLINDNPAGLAAIPGMRLDVSLALLKTDIDYSDPQNSHHSAKDDVFILPDVGFSIRVAEAPVPVTLGLGVFVPAGYGAEYHLFHPVYGNQKYMSEAKLFKFMPTVAVDLGHGLSVGAGVGLAYEKVDLEAPYTFQTGPLAGAPALVDLSTDGLGLAWNIGLQYRITDRWTVGAAYIAETRVETKGSFTADVTGFLPLPDTTARYDVDVENTWPRSLGVGTAYRFDRATASLDLLWLDWSSAFDALTFHLKNGDNPFFDGLAGTQPSDRFPLEWHDSYTVRLGGEFLLTPADTLRGGYVYITNPIPERTMTPLLPGILEHSISLGYGHHFETAVGKLGVDLAYQFSWGRRRNVGTSEIIGGDFDQSSLLAMAHWFFIGASLSF